jgi:hypothetical protein
MACYVADPIYSHLCSQLFLGMEEKSIQEQVDVLEHIRE